MSQPYPSDTFEPQQTHYLYFEMEGLMRRVKLTRTTEYAVVQEGYPFYALRREVRADILTDATPAARMAAAERGVPLNAAQGTGEDGRILKSDVLAISDDS